LTLIAGLLASGSARANTYTWTGASGTDLFWATAGNWTAGGPPGAADVALFDNTIVTNSAGAAAADNILATSRMIQDLSYTNNIGYHNTLINPGITLTVSNTAADNTLFVGGSANVATTNTISGPGASLVITNVNGNINIRHGGSSGTGIQRATLDLSALDNLNASIARLLLAGDGSTSATNSREVGTLYLARTNVIVASGTAPAVNVADNPSNGAGTGVNPTNLTSILYLGQTNAIYADSIAVGRSKCAGIMLFNPAFIGINTPSAYFRGHSASRVSLFTVGDDNGQTTSNQAEQGTVDFSGGTVDFMVDSTYVGRGPAGSGNASGSATGALTIGAGNFDVNTFEIAYQANAGSASPETGTVNLNGGTLVVNTILELAHYSGTGGTAQGTLSVSGGTVTAKGPITAGGGISTIGFNGGTLNLTNVTITAGTLAKPISNFSVTNAIINLAVNPGTTNLVASTLTASGNTLVNIASLVGFASYPTQITLIQSLSGPIQGDGGGAFSLGTMPGNVSATLVNNTGNNSIDLYITSGPIPLGLLTWKGLNGSALNGNWDVGVTPNWLLSGSPSAYQDANPVVFDDSAATNAVNLTTTLLPTSVTVSNNTKTYTLGGAGKISGGASLTKLGAGTLILNETGGNNFAGGMVISNGIVQVGNGGSGGNVGIGNIDNETAMVFMRSNTIVVPGNISGAGSVTQLGSGILTLSGANTFTGNVVVATGTLIPNNSGALGDPTGITIVSNGASLDLGAPGLGVNALNITNEVIVVSGTGVNGNGVIVNSSSLSQEAAIHFLVLAGDTTFGGPGNASGGGNTPGRWDMRNTGGPATLTCQNGNPYNLTKIGSNQVTLVNVTVDPNLANITVRGGVFGVQGSTTLGDPSKTLTLSSNTLLHFAGFSTPFSKVLIMTNAQVDCTGTGINQFGGPVTLIGSNSFTLSNPLTLTNTISGSASLYKFGASTLTLSGNCQYTGNTYVNAGTLALIDPANVTSSLIYLGSNATIDVSGRIDQTLTLNAGQTLTGLANGTIGPSLTNNPGSSVFVGGPGVIGVLNVAGTISMNGTIYMDVTNAGTVYDQVQAITAVLGGTLVVSNLDKGNPFAPGQSFQLIFAGSYAGMFNNIVPAQPGPNLAWDTSQLASGLLGVLYAPQPDIVSCVQSGSNLLISGTNGTPGQSYQILNSTNVALPFSQWTTNTSGHFDGSGNFSFSVTVDKNGPQRFYGVKTP